MALEAAHMAAWDHDLLTDRITLAVSDESLFGDKAGTYNFGELTARVHPEDRDEHKRWIDRTRRERAPFTGEARLIVPGGSVRWVLNRGRFCCNEAGEVVRVLGVTMDITERKLAEEALRQGERRYRLLFESMAQGVVYQDARGSIVNLNPAAERILRAHYNELKGRTSVDWEPYCIHADGSPFPAAEHPAMVALQTGRILRNVLMGVRDPNAEDYRWIDITAVPLFRDGEDRPHQVCSLFDDITERKRAEDALRASERQFRSIFLASLDGIVIADDEGRYTDANPMAGELFGLPCDQLPGRRIAEFLEPGFDFPAAWGEFRSGAGSRGTTRLVRPDGSIREVEHSSSSDFLPGRHMAILHDVTERNRAEAELRRYAARLANLRDIDRAILAIQPPEKIARVALGHLARLVPCWRASVATIDQVARQGRILASIGALSRRMPPGTMRPLSMIDPKEIRTFSRGQSCTIGDLQQCTALPRHLELLRDHGARSVVCLPMRVRGRLIGSLKFCSDRPAAYTPEIVEVIREAADQLAIALDNARLYEENRLARERSEVLSRRLIHAQEDERRHVARELHDQIGQALTSVRINLQRVEHPPGRAGGRMHRDRGRRAAARAQHGAGPAPPAAGRSRARRRAALVRRAPRPAHGHAWPFRRRPRRPAAAPEVETACFRVAQEGLTNIARHAGATRFGVELSRDGHGLELIVRDDGCGFDTAEALRRRRGLLSGALGMIERIELVGGKIAFVSAPGKGTEIRISIPGAVPDAPAARRPGGGR